MKAISTDQPLASLLDPAAAPWSAVAATVVALDGTPLAMQPTAAVRNSWRDRPIGAVRSVEVRALQSADALAFHLRWADDSANRDHGDNTVFPDAAAIALPLHADAPLITMGAPGTPLTAWFWRADSGNQGFEVRAEGPGSTRITGRSVQANALWSDGVWQLVLARSLAGEGTVDSVVLASGQASRFGVAVWEGGRGERGGLKAFSGDWRDLLLA